MSASMKGVWVICQKASVNHGHGDYREAYQLATLWGSGGLHPAFEKEEDAKAYVSALAWSFGLQPVRLEMST